jgi:trimeric autotransporter adhesin
MSRYRHTHLAASLLLMISAAAAARSAPLAPAPEPPLTATPIGARTPPIIRPPVVRVSLYGLASDRANGLLIADNVSHRVFRLDLATGASTLVAGTGQRGFRGDGGLAVDAQLSFPTYVALDADGNVFIADSANNRVRRVDARTGIISTVAGNGTSGFAGDNGPATSAALNGPNGLALDGDGNLYIADTGNQRVRAVDLESGVIRTVAGNGYAGWLGDTGRAVRANLSRPTGLAVDGNGNLFISDTNSNRIRRVELSTGIITRYAGSWSNQALGDHGPAHRARLNDPAGIALDHAGNLYIADGFQHRVRRVDARTGIITTVAGRGVPGSDGDRGPAVDAALGRPAGVAVDAEGNLFVVDTAGSRLRRIDARTGIITTVPVPAPARVMPMPADAAGQ